MSRVVLGNRHATDSTDNGRTRFAAPRGKRALVLDIPEGTTLTSALVSIVGAGGVWDTQTQLVDEVDGERVVTSRDVAPAWVASDDDVLATVLSAHWGGIEIRTLEEPA